MGIFTRDLRPAKQDMLEAITIFSKDQDINRFMTEAEAFRSAVPLNRSFLGHCQKLAISGNHQRIVKLVGVISDHELRWWVKIPVLLLLWPFFLIARIVKAGLP